MSSRRAKRRANAVDDRPTAIMIGGPYDRVAMHLNEAKERIQLGKSVDTLQTYCRLDDPDTGKYLGFYVWEDPDAPPEDERMPAT